MPEDRMLDVLGCSPRETHRGQEDGPQTLGTKTSESLPESIGKTLPKIAAGGKLYCILLSQIL